MSYFLNSRKQMSLKEQSRSPGFLKRLASKLVLGQQTAHQPSAEPFPTSDAPPWLPPLTALGQEAQQPPRPSPSPSPHTYPRDKRPKVSSSPPVLNLPLSIAPPVSPPLPRDTKPIGPLLPPVATIDTKLDIFTSPNGFLTVPGQQPQESEKQPVARNPSPEPEKSKEMAPDPIPRPASQAAGIRTFFNRRKSMLEEEQGSVRVYFISRVLRRLSFAFNSLLTARTRSESAFSPSSVAIHPLLALGQ